MAVLPLYLIAIPRRRSLAAGIQIKLRETERGLYTRSEQLQAGQILRIDHADRRFVVVHHDEIIDSMRLGGNGHPKP